MTIPLKCDENLKVSIGVVGPNDLPIFSFGRHFLYKCSTSTLKAIEIKTYLLFTVTNTVVIEPEASTPMVLVPTIGHDAHPEPEFLHLASTQASRWTISKRFPHQNSVSYLLSPIIPRFHYSNKTK